MGDRIAVLKDGVLQQIGTPRDLYENPTNVFVAGFIGSPAMNLFQSDFTADGVKFGSHVVKVDRATLGSIKGKQVTVGIRPEDVTLASSGTGLPVEVDVIEELGADGNLFGHADVEGVRVDLCVRVDGRKHPVAGDKVFLTPKEGFIHLFDVTTGERIGKAVAVPAEDLSRLKKG
jgi:multiple sugar transport system ATP-binding protein